MSVPTANVENRYTPVVSVPCITPVKSVVPIWMLQESGEGFVLLRGYGSTLMFEGGTNAGSGRGVEPIRVTASSTSLYLEDLSEGPSRPTGLLMRRTGGRLWSTIASTAATIHPVVIRFTFMMGLTLKISLIRWLLALQWCFVPKCQRQEVSKLDWRSLPTLKCVRSEIDTLQEVLLSSSWLTNTVFTRRRLATSYVGKLGGILSEVLA